MRVLLTGGAGFIGSAAVRRLISETKHYALNIDKLTHAASTESLCAVDGNPLYRFLQDDISDTALPQEALGAFPPDAVVRLAVADRQGHDFRYATDTSTIERDLDWSTSRSFEAGLDKSLVRFLNNEAWWRSLLDCHAGERPGTALSQGCAST